MTWTTAIESGSCNYALWLEIVGFGVFGSVKHTPSDTWCNEYSTEGRVYPWLIPDSINGWREDVDFLEATLRVSGISPVIADVGGGMTALFRHYRSGAYTRLSAQLSSTATTASVDSAAEFTSSGLLWIGGECCKYTGKTATSFSGLTRAYLGTQATTHKYNVDVLPPRRPLVGDNPASLVGRRAYLHFASFSHVTNEYSATEIIYRGRVRKGVKVQDAMFTVPIEHISEALRQKIGRGMGEAKLRGRSYYYGTDRKGPRRQCFFVQSSGTTTRYHTIVNAGQYDHGTLFNQLKSQMATTFSGVTSRGWYPFLDKGDDGKVLLRSKSTAANVTISFGVTKYSPLWCLGFEAGEYAVNTDSEAMEWEAEEDGRPFIATSGGRFSLKFENERELTKLSSKTVWIPGESNTFLLVRSTGTTEMDVTASSRGAPVNIGKGGAVLECEDDKSLVVRDAIFLSGYIGSVIKQCYGMAPPYHTTASEYFASGVLTTDFNFTELDDNIDHEYAPLIFFNHLVTEETEIQRLIGPAMAIVGVCPRLTDAGKIGFAGFDAPTALNATDVEVDRDVWANVEAARIASELNATPLVNIVSVGINRDYRKKNDVGEWVNCFNVDGINELGETKRIAYESMIKAHALSMADITERINERATTFHFPIFGRESATVEIPCNWRAKQIKCGDIVKVTHELIYDIPRGTIGVTDALGLVVGRKVAFLSGTDTLVVRIFSGNPWKSVAPTAKATSYSSTAAYMYCSSVALYSKTGETDLDVFASEAPVNVRLLPYDVAGSTSYLATVTSVNTGTKRIYFSSAPLTTAEWTTSGFWVVMADWDNRTQDAVSGYAYIADASTTMVLGSSGDDPHRWGP